MYLNQKRFFYLSIKVGEIGRFLACVQHKRWYIPLICKPSARCFVDITNDKSD